MILDRTPLSRAERAEAARRHGRSLALPARPLIREGSLERYDELRAAREQRSLRNLFRARIR